MLFNYPIGGLRKGLVALSVGAGRRYENSKG